jgi:hypothetical protein
MMDASQVAAAARATAEASREAARVARSMQGDNMPARVADFAAASWDRFAFEIEKIDRTS